LNAHLFDGCAHSLVLGWNEAGEPARQKQRH